MIYKDNEVAIKSVKERVIEGVGVRFGSPETKDHDNEWFHDESDVGLDNGSSRPFILDHGWNPNFGKARTGNAVYEKSGVGWAYQTTFLDSPLGMKAYEEIISKPYRSSAGAAAHTRSATLVKDTFRLDTWYIGEQSATLSPSDGENPLLVRVKSDPLAFMMEEVQRLNHAFIVDFLESYSKGSTDARDRLAVILSEMKDSFKNEHMTAPPVTSELLIALEQVVQPVPLIHV